MKWSAVQPRGDRRTRQHRILVRASGEYFERVQPSRALSIGRDKTAPPHAIASLLSLGGVLTVFLLTMLWLGGAHPGVPEACIFFGGALAVIVSGELLLRLCGLDSIPTRGPVALVVGAIVTSLCVLAGVLATGAPAGPVFLGWAAIIAAALVVTRHRISWRGRSSDFMDCAVVAILAVLLAFWCRNAAAALPTLQATGVLPVWIDYYIHGATIAQFGSIGVDRGAIDLAGQPLTLYHYGGFMVAALVGAVADLPALGLAAAILLPVGLLIGAVGSYALAATLAGPLAGAVAVAFLTLLPDASHYGLANGSYGFHWLMFTAPGSGYALGAIAVALLLANEWLRNRNRHALTLAILLIAALFQLRAVFLPVVVPAFATWLACDTSLARRHARILLWVIFSAVGIGAILVLAVPAVRNFWLDHSVVIGFLKAAHQGNHPTAYDGLYAHHVGIVGQTAAIPFGIALLLLAILGGFVLLYPLTLWVRVRRAGWQIIDLFPPLLLFAYVAVVLLAPVASNGSNSEFQHRPFVVVYQIVAIWTSVYFCRLVFGKEGMWTTVRSLYPLMVVAGASVVTGWLTGFEPAQPKPAWSKLFYQIPIAPGIVDAANFVRRAARRGDVVAVAPVDTRAILIDHAIQFVSLTNAPSYLARPGIHIMQGGHRREVTMSRIAQMNEVEASTDPAAAFALLRGMGVTWYVRIGEAPAFDANKSHAAFAATNASVYRIEPREPAM